MKNKYTLLLLMLFLAGCSTVPKVPKPDVMIHEDKGPIFWYQVWEREDGTKYIKELYRGQIKNWN